MPGQEYEGSRRTLTGSVRGDSMDESLYWVALSLVSKLGARRIRRLVDFFGSARAAFNAPPEELYAAGIHAQAVAALVEERTSIDPASAFESLRKSGFGVLTLYAEGYPPLLKAIYDPPAVLYYRGHAEVLCAPCVAVVGSRRATAYGRAAAFRLGESLGRAGVTVVSGMARGIDTSAHQGVLHGEGTTAAVLGCGLDICYPPENRRLRERIVEKGVVLSEFPPGVPPKPAHFPLRNRIISGLSLATVVVEAGERSGALITADCALEQGRDVFAVPGSVTSPYSRGTHRLLKDGAGLAESAADILSALGMAAPEPPPAVPVTALQEQILSAMEFETMHFDELVSRTGLAAAAVFAALSGLELASLVRKLPGNYYLRV